MESTVEMHCRVCGLGFDNPPWGEDDASPSFEICPCCGTEFGYEDCLIEAARKQRSIWIAKGASWSSPQRKPEEWDFFEQVKNIPRKWV